MQVALGKVVRARRSSLGYSQEAFADVVGLHRTYVGAFERRAQCEPAKSSKNCQCIEYAPVNFTGRGGSRGGIPNEGRATISMERRSGRDVNKQLVDILHKLNRVQVSLLLEMARAMTVEIEQYIAENSDILVLGFNENFSNRLIIHHATHAEKFKKKLLSMLLLLLRILPVELPLSL